MGCNQRILTNKTKILRNVQIHIFNTLKKKTLRTSRTYFGEYIAAKSEVNNK